MGKPVVASALPMVERTFPPGTVAAYRPGDSEAMATAILGFVDDPVAREAATVRTMAIVRERSWEHEASAYVALVDRLIERVPAAPPDERVVPPDEQVPTPPSP
jgi:glycosyltransferase involved in cell wall biosynthesis